MSVEDRSISEVAIALPANGGPDARACDEVTGWLVARADRRASFHGSWRQWIVRSAGLPIEVLDACPEGPCAAREWLGEAVVGTWARARPVHLVAAMDHLRLAPRQVLELSAQESAALLASVNEHVAGSGLRFHAARPGEWLLESEGGIDCDSPRPEEAQGANLREFRPRGKDAGELLRLQTEIQMLLHEHPVNDERVRSGRPAANSLWLWGFGAVRHMAERRLAPLYSDDPWLLGLWRFHGGPAPGLEDLARPSPASPGLHLVALTGEHGVVAANEGAPGDPGLEQAYLAHLRAALRGGGLQRLRFLFGGTQYELSPRARWRFWRRSAALPGARA